MWKTVLITHIKIWRKGFVLHAIIVANLALVQIEMIVNLARIKQEHSQIFHSMQFFCATQDFVHAILDTMTILSHLIVLVLKNPFVLKNFHILIACHYTCQECFGPNFDMCSICPETRGNLPNNTPIYNECPCSLNLIDYHQQMCLGYHKNL